MRSLRQGFRLARQYLRETTNAFNLPERHFKYHFGLTKRLVRLLIEELRPFATEGRRSTRIPIELRVLTALNFYTSGSYQKKVGQDFLTCLSQSAVSKIIREISRLISVHLHPKYVCFPNTVGEINEIKSRFRAMCGIDGIIGCVDGTHVTLSGLPKNVEHAYVDREHQHSLNVMLVCDSDLFIMNVNANFPGSCHDSYVWEQSDLCYFLERKFSGPHNNSFLLGDSGYGLKPWLITPFRNESTARERRFNYILSQARSVIERTNGRLKNLFRCLNSERKLRYRPEIAGQIVVACCVIHNILISSQMIARGHHFFEEYAEEIPDRPINPQANHFDDGEVVRQRLMDLVVN